MIVFLVFILKSFVYLFLTYILFGIDWSYFKKQMIWCIFLFSLFMFLLLFLKLPIEMTVVAYTVFNLFLFKSFFPFSWNVAALMSLSRSAIQTLVEGLMTHFGVISRHYIDKLMDFPTQELIITCGVYFLMLLIGLFLYTKKISLFKWFTVRHTEYTNYLVVLMIMFLLQDDLIHLMSIRNSKMAQYTADYFLIISMISIFIMGITIFSIYSFGKQLEFQTMQKTERVYLRNIEELIFSVRSQRHDYHNHLQVISGLLHQKEYEEADEYLKELNLELQSQQALMQLDHTPLAALIQAKKEIAQIHHIVMKVEVYTLIPPLEIKSYELVQILGNLLDNAIEEELNVPPERRIITLTIDRMLNSLVVFRVHNANSWIEENRIEKVFQEGYTTKENHKGLGLITAKRISCKYQGYIDVESDPHSGTMFSVFIPFIEKNRQEVNSKCPIT
ncbi:sensor histidine kinase [Metabacillus arenae]|uniref:Spo0B domain-containing protein n=1 Tax=Metabacillus arenae TaxID=2771434 RepID=A0A926NL45_9BACI|nr:Spo0B domain-containing protein [Metabacillus arenae]MBD1382603.1 Spo0B domain-containing protein [Metabacillus arenae]